MMAGTTSAQSGAVRALQGAAITQILGRLAMKNVNKSQGEIAAIYAASKTTHASFSMGSKFGFAAAISKPKKSSDCTTKYP